MRLFLSRPKTSKHNKQSHLTFAHSTCDLSCTSLGTEQLLKQAQLCFNSKEMRVKFELIGKTREPLIAVTVDNFNILLFKLVSNEKARLKTF